MTSQKSNLPKKLPAESRICNLKSAGAETGIPPQPLTKWEGILDATKEKDGCISRNMYTNKVEGGEDCLFLNVYTPKLPGTKQMLKPVIVWIHGGAFQFGSTKTELYGPDYLLTEDIVLVTVSYRFGALGFLCLEDSTLNAAGNNGFRDIILGLKWIQENIASFSGDPNNVTLAGESSGAASVHYMMLSPITKGLFHKIILQSGCALNHFAQGRRDSAKLMAKNLGLSTNSEKDILEFLQNQPLDVIFANQEKMRLIHSAHVRRHFYPVIEKTTQEEPPVICEHPVVSMKKGNYHKMIMIIGHVSHEAMFLEFLIRSRTKNNPNAFLINNFEEFIPQHLDIPLGSQLSKYIANEIKSFYFNDEVPTLKHRKQFYEAQGDANFTYLIYVTALMHLKNLGHQIYFFRFTFDGKLNIYKQHRKIDFPGASHCDDVCYLFKLSPVKKIIEDSPEDLTIRRMVKLWSNFARAGDPNGQTCNELIPIKWKPIEDGKLYFLDIGNDICLGVNPEQERLKFWNKIYSLHPFLGKL